MKLLQAFRTHLHTIKQCNTISHCTHQYKVYDNDKYVGVVTFSADNLNTAKMLVNRLNHYKINTVVIVKTNLIYEFTGMDQSGNDVKLIAKRAY